MRTNHLPLRPLRYSTHPRARRSAAFTLVEILVALAVMMLMMVVVFVPLNMGLDMFHIGKARAEVQQANQLVISRITAELRQAVHVFPNEHIPGITDRQPYTNNTTAPNFGPYFDTAATPSRVSNTARIDFLLPATADGSVLAPLSTKNYIVTYYARRLSATEPYHAFANPIVMFRAQYPYRNDDGSPSSVANLSGTRYDDWTNAGNSWLMQTSGEPNLSAQSGYSATTVSASHAQITPRDTVLVSPQALAGPPSYQPSSSFTCDDSNGDGKIDRVTINLLLAKHDAIGADGERSQQIHSSQTVDLPNIK